MRIIFTGSGEFGLATLRSLLESGHELAAVFTQPDRPAGRGRKLLPTPVGQFAVERGLPLIRTNDFNAQPLPAADVMIVIAFGQKISQQAAAHPRLGSVNLHASRLPRLRGAAPINWAILRGEKVTGNSVIRLAQKMDGGAVLAQSQMPIGETETAGELHDRLAIDGAGLIRQVLDDMQANRAVETPQENSLATAAPKLGRDIGRINWQDSADQIARQIRGLFPWPSCRVNLLDGGGGKRCKLTLVRAVAVDGEGPRWHPGEITMAGDVEAGQGAVRLLEVQPESGRPMPLDDYRRGHIWTAGMRLEST